MESNAHHLGCFIFLTINKHVHVLILVNLISDRLERSSTKISSAREFREVLHLLKSTRIQFLTFSKDSFLQMQSCKY